MAWSGTGSGSCASSDSSDYDEHENRTSRQYACAVPSCKGRRWWGYRRDGNGKNDYDVCNECRNDGVLVPKDEEMGWAKFQCECGHAFTGYCAMDNISECYQCGEHISPEKIMLKRKGNKKSKQNHTCGGCAGEDYKHCPHPGSRHYADLALPSNA